DPSFPGAVKRAFGNQVHVAADGVAIHVRRGRFDHLDALDRIGTDGLELELAAACAGSRSRVGDAVAVLADRAQVLAHPADPNIAKVAADRFTLHARQATREVGGITREAAA